MRKGGVQKSETFADVIFVCFQRRRKRRQVSDFFDERDLELNPENLATATTRRTTLSAGPASGLSATAATATAVLNQQRNFDDSASAVSPATTERSSSSLAGLNDIGDVLSGVSRAKKTSPLTPTTTPTTAATSVFEDIKDDYYNLSPETLAMSDADKVFRFKYKVSVVTVGPGVPVIIL